MSAVSQSALQAVAEPTQPLRQVRELKDLEALKGKIVAYVANGTAFEPASYPFKDLSFGFIKCVPSQRMGEEPSYGLHGILRGAQPDLLLVDNDGYQTDAHRLTNLTTYQKTGARQFSNSPTTYTTYRIAVRMGIASPEALKYLEQQLDANFEQYQADLAADKINYPNCHVMRSEVARDANSTYVAGISFHDLVRTTLEKPSLSVDAPKPAEPSSTTDGKQE